MDRVGKFMFVSLGIIFIVICFQFIFGIVDKIKEDGILETNKKEELVKVIEENNE